jgi:hypothetical protein
VTVGIPTLPAPETPRPGSGRRLAALALVALVAAGAGAAWWQTRSGGVTPSEPGASRAAAIDDTLARAPSGARVRVRVVNTSGVAGLARRATQHLRDFGFDVVDFASGATNANAGTRITVHTGHPDWAARAKKALGVGVVATDADTSRHVDLTVFIGHDWRPPTESLRP